jgi:proton glutamate symport protein
MAALTILIALILGLALGVAGTGWGWADKLSVLTDLTGTLWLNALKMTIIPLVVSLLITGITQTAEAAKAGKLATRSVLMFLALLWASTIFAALFVPFLLSLFPLDAGAGAALKSTIAGKATMQAPPGLAEFFKTIIPTNPITAAANDAILPLTIFTMLFAFAMLRLPAEKRAPLTSFFESLGDTMLIIIQWVLWLAPVGVFALAFTVGAQSGFAALGALAHYVLIVSAMGVAVLIASYAMALFGARLSLARFQKAVLPAQAVAISTQSSLASLPAMLKATAELGVKPATANLVLPVAVALYRATSPGMNLAVAIYIAHWFGVHLTPGQLAVGVAVAATTTLGSVSLPGSISFISAIAPIVMAMGLPIEPLALLIAVETLPDIFRTLGNVTMDTAVTAAIARKIDTGDCP